MKGKLLIIHGTGDDNVRFQGTQTPGRSPCGTRKKVDFMEYPSCTRAISEGTGTTLHVYRLIVRYIEDHL